jgi:hypothetical protein
MGIMSEVRIRKMRLWKILLLSILFVPVAYFFVNYFNVAVLDEKKAWIDEFTTVHPRWEWNYTKGSGYKRLAKIDNLSVVEIGITDKSSLSNHSDCSLHENRYQHVNGILEVRLRCTDDNGFGGSGKGTRGWGFWNFENPSKIDVAWFWSASSESDPSLSGFQVMVARDSNIVFQQRLPQIDMRNWHVYKIQLSPTGTQFFVDGNEVASTSQRPIKPQRIEIWIDNQRIGYKNNKPKALGLLDVRQSQQMYIDWVSYLAITD